jgi:hypothetical protein
MSFQTLTAAKYILGNQLLALFTSFDTRKSPHLGRNMPRKGIVGSPGSNFRVSDNVFPARSPAWKRSR